METTFNRRSVFGRSQPNIMQRKITSRYADRFVSRRAGSDYQITKSKIFSNVKGVDTNADLFNQDPYGWRSRGYVNLLESTLKNYTPESKILHLTEEVKSENCKPKQECDEGKGWHCVPRKRPVIGQPDLIFDLPGYQDYMQHDILDWGKRDLLVAALKSQIFMWHSPSNNVLTLHEFQDDVITVTKWDPSGVYIAVGTFYGRLCIIDSNTKKCMQIPWQCYKIRPDDNSSITALAWSTQGYQLACCTCTGMVCTFDTRSSSNSARIKNAHSSDITAARFSPDGQFLVTCGLDCMVRLWCLPDIIPFFEIVYANPARALAWHPWRGCQLAVGGGLGAGQGLGDGSLSVWDVARQTNLCHRLSTVPCAVDALAWSSHTAELAVSYWLDRVCLGNEEEIPGHSRLLILSSPGSVTDELCAPLGRTRALLFNPDGTKIASASSDENLFIWNFLGKQGPLLNMYKRKIKKQSSYRKLREINEFNNFGIIIR
ncbi:protein cortex-like [Arctopsyche grandis]|uniref:protein cortex-like n=1 Tax=Arctopsyche grandis TaxID=121162 RepID=UPI00406D687E